MDNHFLPLRVEEIRAQQCDNVTSSFHFQQQTPSREILLEGTMIKTEDSITALDKNPMQSHR